MKGSAMSEQPRFSRHASLENFDPTDFERFLGKAPVLGDQEDPAEYYNISHLMLESIGPSNFIEQLFVIDLIDQTFEILNLRRAIVACKATSGSAGVEACLKRGILVGAPPGAEKFAEIEARREAQEWGKDPDSRDDIEERIRGMGISEEAMEVEIFLHSLPALEILEKRLFS